MRGGAVNRVSFVVLGTPVSKPRPRVTARGTFMPVHYIAWRSRVADEASAAFAEHEERGGPWDAHGTGYGVRCRFYVERANGGDADGLAGGVLDALNKLAFADDRLVAELRVSKRIDKARPRVEVELWGPDVQHEDLSGFDRAVAEASADVSDAGDVGQVAVNEAGSEGLLEALREATGKARRSA